MTKKVIRNFRPLNRFFSKKCHSEICCDKICFPSPQTRCQVSRDVNKDLTPKDQDKDKDLTPKDEDKDKDLSPKDKDKDKDLTPKDQDKDKDLKYVLKDKDED